MLASWENPTQPDLQNDVASKPLDVMNAEKAEMGFREREGYC